MFENKSTKEDIFIDREFITDQQNQKQSKIDSEAE